MDCGQVAELVTDYLEDALKAEERDWFDGHVNACAGCGRLLDRLRAMIGLLGHLRAADIPADVMSALCQAFAGVDPRDWSKGLI
ncbi:zf-HC2 domain-containing protein [Streptosporangiaceae bacterium NEAU-GS5]|nr:zf-HC2 domain-containing protein [Streptosporangiaceae bacterium NEAU-GS5]